MIAAVHGQYAILNTLLQYGAGPNSRGTDGRTALHIAVEYDHAELVEVLLDNGANSNARLWGKLDDRRGGPPPLSTPLHLACRLGNAACVRALLRGGADEFLEEYPQIAANTGSADDQSHGNGDMRGHRSRAIDVVGRGRFRQHEDPNQYDGYELPSEYSRRRDLINIERIKQILLRAPLDRRWNNKSWLMLLKSRYENAISSSWEGSVSDDNPTSPGSIDRSWSHNKNKTRLHGRHSRSKASAAATVRSNCARRNTKRRWSPSGEREGSEQTQNKQGKWSTRANGGAGLREVCENLFSLARIEEGAFRHVVQFL